MAGADQVGGLPESAHEAGRGVGIGAQEEMADLVGQGMAEDARQIHVTYFVDALSGVVKEVGVAAGAVAGEVGNPQVRFIQIEGTPSDPNLKVCREISSRARGWV